MENQAFPIVLKFKDKYGADYICAGIMNFPWRKIGEDTLEIKTMQALKNLDLKLQDFNITEG